MVRRVMKHFHIVKDGVGGKLIIESPAGIGCAVDSLYLTNDELKELYKVLGELWINQANIASAKAYCQGCIELMLGHGAMTAKRLPDGLDVESYKAGFEDCLDYIQYGKNDKGTETV